MSTDFIWLHLQERQVPPINVQNSSEVVWLDLADAKGGKLVSSSSVENIAQPWFDFNAVEIAKEQSSSFPLSSPTGLWPASSKKITKPLLSSQKSIEKSLIKFLTW